MIFETTRNLSTYPIFDIKELLLIFLGIIMILRICLKRSLFRYKYREIYDENDLLYKMRYAMNWLLLKFKDMHIRVSWYESSTSVF